MEGDRYNYYEGKKKTKFVNKVTGFFHIPEDELKKLDSKNILDSLVMVDSYPQFLISELIREIHGIEISKQTLKKYIDEGNPYAKGWIYYKDIIGDMNEVKPLQGVSPVYGPMA